MTERSAERRLGARYRLDEADGSWWELGWDRPLATFYAQHYSPVPFDPHAGEDVLDWVGTDFAEVATTGALAARLPVALPEEVERELAADAAAHPNLGPPPFLGAAQRLLAALDAGGEHPAAASPATFAGSAADVDRPGPDAHPAGEDPAERWSLPAAPVAAALRALHADPALADDDLDTFATGLGLRAELVAAVLAGGLDEVDVDVAAAVCEALRCTPTQLWGPALAHQIAHAYRPAEWPLHTEPLPNHPIGPTSDAAGAVGNDGGRLVLVTCYGEAGVVAVDWSGRSVAVNDETEAADQGVDYHCRYRQMADPCHISVAISDERLADGPTGHVDAEPALTTVAQRLRDGAWPDAVDLVRFTAPDSGAEQWLGWDAAVRSWQTWDDPRRYFAGEPQEVLDTAGFATADQAEDGRFRLDEIVIDPSPPGTEPEDVVLASGDPFDL